MATDRPSANAPPGALSSRSERVEVLARMRFDEREVILPVGLASLEKDELGRQVVAIRLALGGGMFLPLWDLLTLAGLDPRGVGG